ncbi:hypothetical protein PVT68_02655 [Microbulbifer bruguierae]|uniref:Uncharacterized protein n=1 Tax=Microbulbifer bruguierae TaxID=3029061 RepID=A0ABY8NFK1_9GAMM|nr:hypothetical protein [Microbulbifer bruguierae]WGL17210.1 hypothetical protein PVT68_02655 [Microbulbifer bruguierae]
MDWITKIDWAEVITVSAESPLGIVALATILAAAIVLTLFKNAVPRYRLIALGMFFIGLIAMGKTFTGNVKNEMDTIKRKDLVLDCIDKKTQELEEFVREEVIQFGVAAGLGSPLACKTVTVSDEKIGDGPRAGELMVSQPKCKLVSALVQDRAQITECQVRDGKPVISVKVRGRGCEYANQASFLLTAEYKRESIPQNEIDDAKEQCALLYAVDLASING